MQPINHTYDTCSQISLNRVINGYLRSKGEPTIDGSCYGLVLHHCVKKFKGDEFEHTRLIQRVCAEMLEGVSKSEELQKFCERVVQFQDPNASTVKRKITRFIDKDELDPHFPFHFTAAYPYNPTTGSRDHLAELLRLIVSVSKTVEKYIFLKVENHVLGLAIKGNSYSFYDPNHDSPQPPVSFDNELSPELFASVVSEVSAYSSKLSLSLLIEVITTQDIGSAMNECEALKQLQKEILKADQNQRSETGHTPFMHAMRDRHFDNAKDLRESHANPDLYYGNCNSPIKEASLSEDVEAIDELVGMGANIDLPWEEGRTSLWHMSMRGKLEIVQCLLNNGAKVLWDDRGISPQEVAWAYVQILREEDNPAEENSVVAERYKDYVEIIRLLNEAEPSLAYTEPLFS